jgi:hypothetical protein
MSVIVVFKKPKAELPADWQRLHESLPTPFQGIGDAALRSVMFALDPVGEVLPKKVTSRSLLVRDRRNTRFLVLNPKIEELTQDMDEQRVDCLRAGVAGLVAMQGARVLFESNATKRQLRLPPYTAKTQIPEEGGLQRVVSGILDLPDVGSVSSAAIRWTPRHAAPENIGRGAPSLEISFGSDPDQFDNAIWSVRDRGGTTRISASVDTIRGGFRNTDPIDAAMYERFGRGLMVAAQLP